MSDDNATTEPTEPTEPTETVNEPVEVTEAPSTVKGRMIPGQFGACGQVITRAGVCRDARLKDRRCETCEPIFANEATAAAARRTQADPAPAPAPRRPRTPRKPRP